MLPELPPFDEWLDWVFQRPSGVSDFSWYSYEPWDVGGNPVGVAAHLVRLFESPGILLDRFQTYEIAHGIGHLLNNALSNNVFALLDEEVPKSQRQRGLRAIRNLYQEVFAVTCTEQFWGRKYRPSGRVARPVRGTALARSVLGDWSVVVPVRQEDGREAPDHTNMVCYMLWDVCPLTQNPHYPDMGEVDGIVLDIMKDALQIKHGACQESALHGLGHLQSSYLEQVKAIIDQFVADFPELPSSLRRYARSAREGRVL